MNHYVYKIINKTNGHYYIGKRSCSCEIEDDIGYMGSGFRIKNAIAEYGLDNFEKEILFICKSGNEASEKEAELVTPALVDDPNCYNLVLGGSNGYRKSLGSAGQLWKSIDLSVYVEFFNGLKTMSSDELVTLERGFSPTKLDLQRKDKKFRSDEDRMLIWDMHFRRALVQLKSNRTTKEKLTMQFKSAIDIESFLSNILS